ncbi:MAG: Fic family protein [Firmicutes bacterium]|nr:Fic family protein [Bacillota bacterium]
MSKPIDKQQKYTDIFSEIDAAFKTMKALRPISDSALRRYREESDILSSFHSNAIEGNTFTYDETRLLIKDGVTATARSMREHNDILGHSRAYWSLYESLKVNAPPNEKFVLDIHAKVLQGDDYAGRYRDAQVYIGDAVSIKYTAPSADKVPKLLSEYTAKLIEEIPKSVAGIRGTSNPDWPKLFGALAAHHIDFERIHPFFDGNGRTGRLLLNYELLQMGLPPLNITMSDRARYNAAFSSHDAKVKYSSRPGSQYEAMAKLFAECELRSVQGWLKMFASYAESGKHEAAVELAKKYGFGEKAAADASKRAAQANKAQSDKAAAPDKAAKPAKSVTTVKVSIKSNKGDQK